MALLTLLDAQLAYGDLPLLDRAAFSMESGERIGLIGRNGTGKSSLLAVIAGTSALDDGEVRKAEGLRISFVEQEPKLPHAPTLRASLLLRGHVPSIHDERERWQVEARLTEFLHRLGLDEALSPEAASGGERKRAALALAFALQPELVEQRAQAARALAQLAIAERPGTGEERLGRLDRALGVVEPARHLGDRATRRHGGSHRLAPSVAPQRAEAS